MIRMVKMRGQTILLEEEDIFLILKLKELELVDEGITILFQQKGERKVSETEIKNFGAGGYHITLSKEIGDSFRSVLIIPGERR